MRRYVVIAVAVGAAVVVVLALYWATDVPLFSSVPYTVRRLFCVALAVGAGYLVLDTFLPPDDNLRNP